MAPIVQIPAMVLSRLLLLVTMVMTRLLLLTAARKKSASSWEVYDVFPFLVCEMDIVKSSLPECPRGSFCLDHMTADVRMGSEDVWRRHVGVSGPSHELRIPGVLGRICCTDTHPSVLDWHRLGLASQEKGRMLRVTCLTVQVGRQDPSPQNGFAFEATAPKSRSDCTK